MLAIISGQQKVSFIRVLCLIACRVGRVLPPSAPQRRRKSCKNTPTNCTFNAFYTKCKRNIQRSLYGHDPVQTKVLQQEQHLKRRKSTQMDLLLHCMPCVETCLYSVLYQIFQVYLAVPLQRQQYLQQKNYAPCTKIQW